MSDKLQKTDSAIVPASKIADKIASALKDDKPANTGTRWPNADDVCKCGHKYSEHDYSDSLGSETDPLGFMYECRGAGFSEAKLRKRPNGEIYQGAVCACEQFEFTDAPVRIVTDETTCVDGLNLLQHNCPGSVENAAGGRTVCKCSCMNCLAAERLELAKINGDSQPERGVMVSGNGASVFTNSMTCVTCGSTRGEYGIRDHRSCAVVDTSTGSPIVCKCDCKDCKRLWFADGRPVARVENGKRIILRENGSKQTFSQEVSVTLPTESSAKSFDVKVVGADGNPVELSPEVEMPDLRVGCGAEFSVPVNGKTLRCTKWRGHKGDHSDKINGVPINWANK